FYKAIGLRVLGGLAVRPDRLERLAAAARRLARSGPFVVHDQLVAILGIARPKLRQVLEALGYRAVILTRKAHVTGPRGNRPSLIKTCYGPQAAEGHPFAKVRELNLTGPLAVRWYCRLDASINGCGSPALPKAAPEPPVFAPLE